MKNQQKRKEKKNAFSRIPFLLQILQEIHIFTIKMDYEGPQHWI